MQKIGICAFIVLISYAGFSQKTTMLRGSVVTDDASKVTINIINFTKKLGTINDANGFFVINAAIGDTILFSSVQYAQILHVVTADNLQKGNLIIELKLNVNQLDEVTVSKNDLSGNIEEDAKKIKTYEDRLPLFNANELDLTPFIKEKGVATVKNIAVVDLMDATPVNFIALARMTRSVLKKKGKRKKELPKTFKISSYYSNRFLTENLDISETEIDYFLDFLNENSGTKDILESENELKILEFLIQQRDIFTSK